MRKFRFFLLLPIAAAVCLLGWTIWQKVVKNIHNAGPLRVLVLATDLDGSGGLHRIEMPIDRERALLENFAKASQRKIQYIPVQAFPDLFRQLEEGQGELVSANLSATLQRQKKYLLSVPFDYTREVVFASSGVPEKKPVSEMLTGKTGWLLPGTTYVESAENYTFFNPWFQCRILPKTISHTELIEAVCRREMDYAVLNEADLDAWLAYRTGIRKLFPIRSRVPLVFAARKNSGELMRALNRFIQSQQDLRISAVPEAEAPAAAIPAAVPAAVRPKPVSSAPVQPSPVRPAAMPRSGPKELPLEFARLEKAEFMEPAKLRGKEDLDGILKRGYIRMLTSNEVFCCYLKQGQLYGFEYELAKRFADSLNIKIITVIPANFSDLLRYLAEGKGDFIAVNYSRTPERLAAHPDFTFCAPYHGACQVLAGRCNEKIRNVGELAPRKICVRKGNSYYATARKLQSQGVKFTIVPVPENLPSIAVLKSVEAGKYDLTIVDDNFLNFAINGGIRVKKLMTLTEKQPFCWVVRKQNPRLAAAVDAFFRKENRSTFFNLCVKRYYSRKQAQSIMQWVKKNSAGKISPYDSLFRKYAGIYDFNWYFLAAQSYQESHFQANLVNEIGATGLMQIRPATAREMGIANLKNPENSIHAGTKYMSKMRSRFSEPAISRQDQLCFALAAYNAGYGHVDDARLLAESLGLNPYVWFNHTEKALALLEDPRYAAKAKYGFCRASETIPYVRNIIFQGYHYQKMQQTRQKGNEKIGPRQIPTEKKKK